MPRWPRLTEKDDVDLKEKSDKPSPAAVVEVTEKQLKSFTPKNSNKVEYQWLRIPLGTFDFQDPEKLFRNENAQTNKKLIDAYNSLLDRGFEIKAFEIYTEYKYILFERRNG